MVSGSCELKCLLGAVILTAAVSPQHTWGMHSSELQTPQQQISGSLLEGSFLQKADRKVPVEDLDGCPKSFPVRMLWTCMLNDNHLSPSELITVVKQSFFFLSFFPYLFFLEDKSRVKKEKDGKQRIEISHLYYAASL